MREKASTHFCFWRTKTKNISFGSEQKIRARGMNCRAWVARGAERAKPQALASRLPAFLLSRSHVETEGRHDSFCDLGCRLAAKEMLDSEAR
jgi:hypothetical protein